jgi:glycine cleavage system regulatory protein
VVITATDPDLFARRLSAGRRLAAAFTVYFDVQVQSAMLSSLVEGETDALDDLTSSLTTALVAQGLVVEITGASVASDDVEIVSVDVTATNGTNGSNSSNETARRLVHRIRHARRLSNETANESTSTNGTNESADATPTASATSVLTLTDESLEAMLADKAAAVEGLTTGLTSALGVAVVITATDPNLLARRLMGGRRLTAALTVEFDVFGDSTALPALIGGEADALDDLTTSLTTALKAQGVDVAITGAGVSSDDVKPAPQCKWAVAGKIQVTTGPRPGQLWHISSEDAIEVMGQHLSLRDRLELSCGKCGVSCGAPDISAPKAVAFESVPHEGRACELPGLPLDPQHEHLCAGGTGLCMPVDLCLEECAAMEGCGGVQVFEGEPFCTLHPPCHDLVAESATFYELPEVGATILRFAPEEPIPQGSYRACFCDVDRSPSCSADDLLDLGSVVVSALTCGQSPDQSCAAQVSGGWRCA